MGLTPDPSLRDKPRSLGAACLTLSCGIVPSGAGASTGCAGVERHGDGRRGGEATRDAAKVAKEAGGGSAPPMPLRPQGLGLLIGVTPGMCLNLALCASVKWQYPLPSRNRCLKLSLSAPARDRSHHRLGTHQYDVAENRSLPLQFPDHGYLPPDHGLYIDAERASLAQHRRDFGPIRAHHLSQSTPRHTVSARQNACPKLIEIAQISLF